ncbi:hypothetical protein ACPCHT_07750 [Nucisporomicrobium flavum]|uniref:hypothetical protein n=1 Tax=Nucisporomicrobium flavum TaxID=2785915 RepID=UPI003C2B9D0F
MTRILGIEVRRSAALGTVLVLLVAGGILLYAAPQRWAASWMALAMAEREYLVLLWPLALAAGAWQARREHRSHVAELFASTARPQVQRMVPVLGAMAIAAAAAYLLVAAAGLPWIIDTAHYLPARAFLVLAVGVLAMIGGVWLGLAVGRLVPSMVTAPVLAVAGIAFLMLLPVATGHRNWLSLVFSPMYGMGQYTDYQTVGARVSVAQVIWLIAFAVAAAVLLASGGWRTRVAALLPVTLGAALALAVVPRGEFVDNPTDTVAQELVCADGAPRVCVSRVHAGLLSEVVPPARQALAALAKLPDPPTAVHEDTTTYYPSWSPAPQPGVVLLDVHVDKYGHLAWPDRVVPRVVIAALTPPIACEDGFNPSASRAAAAYVLGVEPVAGWGEWDVVSDQPDTEQAALWNGLRKLPEQEAVARVAALRRAAAGCKDLKDALTGSAR